MLKAVSILSGGLDSTVSTAIALEEMSVQLAVTFDYGQRAAKKEISAAAFFCKKWKIRHKVIKLGFLSELGASALTSASKKMPHLSVGALSKGTAASAKAVWVPNRNGIFINAAGAIAESEKFNCVLTGFNKEEAVTFPDNSVEFLSAINRSLKFSTANKVFATSFVKDMEKTEIMRAAVDEELKIEKMWFCYEGHKKWCGICESCARAKRAMKHLGILKKYEDLFLK